MPALFHEELAGDGGEGAIQTGIAKTTRLNQ